MRNEVALRVNISYNTGMGSLENGRSIEQGNITEREYEPLFAKSIISGSGSVGNTSFANRMATALGISSSRIFHAGEIVRARQNASRDVGYITRTQDLDREVDREITRLLSQATKIPTIIEAKLGAVFNRHLQQMSEELGIVLAGPRIAILKYANPEKRAIIARSKPGNEVFSLAELMEKSLERDRLDLKQWIQVHPWLADYHNIHEKDATDNHGKPIYDIVVDSSDSTLEEDIQYINQQLLQRGLLKKI